MRRLAQSACIAIVAAASLTGTAGAVEPGVTVDPGSPSAKEYALPLEAARRDASGESGKPVAPGERDAPLFGAGVTRKRSGAAAVVTASSAGGPDDPGSGGAAGGTGDQGAEANRAAARDDGDGSGSSTALIGGGIGVLLLGLIGGVVLRAMRGPDPA